MSWSSIAPAAPGRPPLRGRAESHPLPIRRTCRYVIRGNGGHGLIRDDLYPLDWARGGRAGGSAGPGVTRRYGHHTGSDVRQDPRTPLLTALGRAHAAAYAAGVPVGRGSFMPATQ